MQFPPGCRSLADCSYDQLSGMMRTLSDSKSWTKDPAKLKQIQNDMIAVSDEANRKSKPKLQAEAPTLKRPCSDCKKEEALPGFSICDKCYDDRHTPKGEWARPIRPAPKVI